MGNFSSIGLVISKNFKQWKVNPRVYIAFIILLVLNCYSFFTQGVLAGHLGTTVSMCIFSFFYISSTTAIIFGAIPMMLYAEAPFTDHYAPFMVIRTGRRNWIIGQILYIIISSFIFTIVTFVMCIIVLLPNVSLELDWGNHLWTIANNPEVTSSIEGMYVPGISTHYLQVMSGGEALLYSLLFNWLLFVFLGLVILCFNVLFRKGTGTTIVGFLTCLAIFAEYTAVLLYSSSADSLIAKTVWISPVSWRNQYLLIENTPPRVYALIFLIVSILVMSVVSVVVFCKKDLEFEKGEY